MNCYNNFRRLSVFQIVPIKGFILLLVLFLPSYAFSSHIRGGEIILRQIQCSDYEITLFVYTNLKTEIRVGDGTLSFGDGTSVTLPSLNNEVIDVKLAVGRAVFKIIHRYADGIYAISYSEPSRNAGILNIPNSGMVNFFVETSLVVSAKAKCNNPITFAVMPIDRACKGMTFFHNPGARDIDGDSISFELVMPRKASALPVDGYILSNDSKYYSSQDYQKSNEAKDGPPTFGMNSITGDLTWNSPGAPGEYVIAIKVTEWRKIDDVWMILGYVNRDMQVVVEDCNNTRPFLAIPPDLCVSPGTKISELIRGSDNESDPVKIEVFLGDIFSSSSVPVIRNSNLLQSTKSPHDTAHVKFDWTITCDMVRDQVYRIIFKVTDDPPNGIRLATFKTWSISVIGNAPTFKSEVLDLAAKSLKLVWSTSECSNAKSMEIWRKVGKDANTLDECFRGIPKAYGYEKLAVVSGKEFFIDKDINPGASYCYRLVALFESPIKSRSRASIPFCFGPVKVDAPTLINVSVNKTDKSNGEMQLRWTSPFQIDKAQFPPPYEYEVFRTNPDGDFEKITDSHIKDTVWTDRQLNTLDKTYGYKVVVYSPTGLTKENPVDTSALAFYPRLEYESRKGGIYLTWNAKVPWSNQSEKYPFHFIYRKDNQATSFVLIDSIRIENVQVEIGFDYLDVGTFNNLSLASNTLYQYKVSTTGTYDNPLVIEPLLNYSNELLAQPIDNSPPCRPVLTVSHISCEEFIKTAQCSVSEYTNVLLWTYPEGCGNDVRYFKVTYQNSLTDEPRELAQLPGFDFSDHRKNSFAGCYQVIAVDFSGNESEPSELECVDNCPNIFIPNILTANEDGFNDVFPGFGNVTDSDLAKCPRFVRKLNLKIYNRWGKEVYVVEKDGTDSNVSNEWKGLDKKGHELSTGVYFYEAEIIFDMLDSVSQKQKSSGWINLVR